MSPLAFLVYFIINRRKVTSSSEPKSDAYILPAYLKVKSFLYI